MTILSHKDWSEYTEEHPETNLLQTAAWGKLKAEFGWEPQYLVEGGVGALILFRRLPFGFSLGYIPRGPIGKDWGDFWGAVDQVCKRQRAFFLKVEPDIWEPQSSDFYPKELPDFLPSKQTIQPPRTILVDLTKSEEDILMAMKSKTRYNIRLAGRKDVSVHPSEDVDAFYRMMLTTGERDEFGIHSRAYYQRAYELFAARDACVLLIAEYNQRPLAGLMAFAKGDTAWYFYGASTNQERNRMPTYLLQWEAIRWAKQKGCKVYDLWGVPDYPEEFLEENFLDRSDGLWGVYRFKRGFGGEIRRTIGAWDRVYNPLLYRFYCLWTDRGTNRPA